MFVPSIDQPGRCLLFISLVRRMVRGSGRNMPFADYLLYATHFLGHFIFFLIFFTFYYFFI